MGQKQNFRSDDDDANLGSQTVPFIGVNNQDLTEEDILAPAEEFSRTAPSEEGVIILKKIKILDANHTLAAMFGYALSELMALPILELILPEAHSVVLRNIMLKQPAPYETIGLKKDGAAFPVTIQEKTIIYQGQPARAIVINKIDEQKQPEILEMLRQTNNKLDQQAKEGTTELRIANEQLLFELDQRKRMEAEITQRHRELLILQAAGSAITSSLDLQHVLNTVTREMAKLLEVDVCLISEWDRLTDTIAITSTYSRSDQWDAEAVEKTSLLENHPLKKIVLANRQSQQININQLDTNDSELAVLQRANINTVLLLPMVFQDKVVGLVEIMDRRTRTFSEQQVSLAQLLANQAASAIENARLYAETEQRAEQLAVLHELDRAITTSLRVSDVYHALAQHAPRLLPYQYMSITLTDDKTITVAYVAGDHKFQNSLPLGASVPYQGSNIGWVIERNQPSLHHNITAGSRFVENDQWLQTGIQSVMILPLRVMGQVIGTWNIGSTQIGIYMPDHLEIAQSIADQLAVAIQNARLYKQARQEISERQRAEQALQEERALLAQRVEERTEEVKQQYRRQTILSEVELAINQPQELQKLLDYISQITAKILQVDGGASIVLWNTRQERFLLRSTTIPKLNKDEIAKHIRLQGGATRWIMDNRQPLGVSVDSHPPFSLNPLLSDYGYKSFAGAPLLTKDDALGVLYVHSTEARHYIEADLDFMMAVANRAAVAITKVRLYEQLERANAELTRAARLKDEFLASMSHELRTPLAAVLGMSELLGEQVYGPMNPQQLKAINTVEESGRHLLTLINDILDLSKIEAGKLDLTIDSVSVEKICYASIQFIRQAAQKKNININSNYDNAVSTLEIDERRLKQILVNLLSNAVKFTPDDGQVGLDVVGDAGNHQVHFTVWDTGVGIAPEDIGKLFQPFVQLDSSLSRQYSGTGLGLAIVKRMVEVHGGTVSVESAVGQGSRFTVSLPWPEAVRADSLAAATRKPDESAIQSEPDTPTQQTQNAPSPWPPKHPPLILIAEDDPQLAELLSDYLKENGFRVIIARNGVEALKRVRLEKPGLILMDIHMPEMDGLETTRYLKSRAEWADIPVIALTALAMPGDRERCLEAGANDYLSKPMQLQEMVKAINAQLTLHP